MLSNNYVQLKNKETLEVISFIPNKEFEIPEGIYVNLNYCYMIDGTIFKAGEVVTINAPKQEVVLTQLNTRAEYKEALRDRGISFGSKATLSELKDIWETR